ncbi:MAG: hypothetical protein GWO24_25330, partial [Akkermansiaceae bacterium]|nr:hypothetical protein [Akkermansiaceae bacterium]
MPAVPLVQVPTGPNWSLLRNLVIIIFLLGAIYGMYRAYEWKKVDLARQKKEQDEREQLQKQARIEEEIRARKAREEAEINPPRVVRPVNIPKEPEPETPLEALARLKPLLAGGEREEFPPDTHVRGSL